MADLDPSKPKTPPKPVFVGGESLADRILPHMKKIIIGVIVVAVVAGSIAGVRAWKHHGQEDRTEKLAHVFDVAQRPVAAPGATPDPKNPAFATAQERAKAVLDEMAKQKAKPPGHAYRGGVLFEAGDLDAAIAEYRRGLDAKGIEGVLAREGLGIALESKAAAEQDAAARGKLLEEALAIYQRMQPDKQGPRHVYALYHQGRVQAALGKTAEAKALFEQATELLAAVPGHELRALLQSRLAALGAA